MYPGHQENTQEQLVSHCLPCKTLPTPRCSPSVSDDTVSASPADATSYCKQTTKESLGSHFELLRPCADEEEVPSDILSVNFLAEQREPAVRPEPPAEKRHARRRLSFPIVNESCESLKQLLRDYLFGALDEKLGYRLSERDLEILRFILRKKVLFSNSALRNSKIASLRQEDVTAFLKQNPPFKRPQILKRVVFTNLWKFCLQQGHDLIRECFDSDDSFCHKTQLLANNGNFNNQYYQNCLRNKRFLSRFLELCKSPEFWSFCNQHSLRAFDRNIDRWIFLIDGLLSGGLSPNEEKSVLMRIKFLPVVPCMERLSRLFKFTELM